MFHCRLGQNLIHNFVTTRFKPASVSAYLSVNKICCEPLKRNFWNLQTFACASRAESVQNGCHSQVKGYNSVSFTHCSKMKTKLKEFDMDIRLGPAPLCCFMVKNLGVCLDSSFKHDKQISSVVKNSFYQSCQIAKSKISYSSSRPWNCSPCLHLHQTGRLQLFTCRFGTNISPSPTCKWFNLRWLPQPNNTCQHINGYNSVN